MIYQELLNKAVAGILAQGCQSYVDNDDENYCAYRGPNCTKCAIGHLLTDEQIEKYNIEENQTPETFSKELIQELAPATLQHDTVQFFQDLQRAHDLPDGGAYFIANFKKRIKDLALKWNLENPCP